MQEGTCYRCGKAKPAADFHRDKTKASGRTSICRPCDSAKRAAHYRANPKPQRPPLEDRHCEACADTYQPVRADQRFCSPACRSSHKVRTTPTITVPCDYCGKPKAARASDYGRWSATYCDRSCAGKARSKQIPTVTGRCCTPRKDRPTPRRFVSVPCGICSTHFLTASARDRYCSDTCAQRAKRERRHQAKAVRRARKRNAYVERVYRLKVYERDDWTCRLCGRKVDRDAEAPDDDAPTMDHILPLKHGGRHEYSNVQTAHFLCNSTKGARITQLSFAA